MFYGGLAVAYLAAYWGIFLHGQKAIVWPIVIVGTIVATAGGLHLAAATNKNGSQE